MRSGADEIFEPQLGHDPAQTAQSGSHLDLQSTPGLADEMQNLDRR